jgi:hypothetical protein
LPSDPIDLPDELRLTQYGEQPPFGDGFRDRLREDIGETELSANRLHVSVYPPLTEAGEPAAWDGELAARFNACFT